MIGSILKATAYSKAPRATFTMLHPGDAMRLRKFRRDIRRSHAPRVAALGAIALALPLGMWLGRRRSRRIEAERPDTRIDAVLEFNAAECVNSPMRGTSRAESIEQATARI